MATHSIKNSTDLPSQAEGGRQLIKDTEKVSPNCITVVPDNLKVEINTPTDFWVVGANGLIGIAGLVTAGAVAWITRRNQISQNRINKASLRQKWQEKFGDTAAKFLGLVSEIAVDTVMETTEPEERKLLATKRLPELLYLRETLLIMLDKRQPYTKDATSEMTKTIEAIRKVDLKTLSESQRELRKHFNVIHEKAWQDIQSDLSS